MDLQVLVALAEIVSALAVLLTLVVLIISIRQNTKSQKALVVDSLAAAITSINVPAMESPVLGAALAKATADWSSASREERIVAHYFLFSLFKLLENAWYQQKAGILDQAHWLGLGEFASKILSCRRSASSLVAQSQACLFARISKVPGGNKAARRSQDFRRNIRRRSI
jgi:hypothetical protein